MFRERKTLTYSRMGSPFPKMAGDLLLEGRVHSVFEHSVNLEVPELPGKLLTLFTASTNTFPGSLYFEELPVEDFHKEDPVLIRENCLIAGRNILIPSKACCEVDLKLKAENDLKSSESRISDLAKRLKETARKARHTKLTGNETESMIYSLLEKRVESLLEDPSDPDKIRSLVGLGFGLTPSGDDMLLGVMAVMTAMDHPAFPKTAEAVKTLAEGTTDVSRSYLLYASEGYFSDIVRQIFSAWKNGEKRGEEDSFKTAAVQEAADRLLSFGHLSGSDTLYGIACALTLIQHR